MPVLDAIESKKEQLISCRRDIHAHPETAFEEFRTAELVAQKLQKIGVDEIHQQIAVTGIVAVIHGRHGKGGPGIGLRADMDALNVEELNHQLDYKSCHHGKMHACGHDGHTAMLLGAAEYLVNSRNFSGTVYLIFQPAEEGAGGGRVMIEEGLFDRFEMQSVWGMHNWPGIAAGTFAVHDSAVLAASDYFEITLNGLGAHAAMPHQGVDPVLASAHLTIALQSLVSRSLDPIDSAVLSVTMMEAANATNIIPKKAVLKGTVRTLTPQARVLMESGLKRISHHTAEAMGCSAQVIYERGYPATVNTLAQAQIAAQVAAQIVGEDKVVTGSTPSLASEDFGYMLEKKPGCYLWLGAGDNNHAQGLHHPEYDFNDEVLVTGSSYWVKLAETLLPVNPS